MQSFKPACVLTNLYKFLALLTVLQISLAAKKRFEMSAQRQDLSTIEPSINWVGCRYKVDQLFALTCPSSNGMWIADAKSLLASSNCVANCPQGEEYGPSLDYRRFGEFLTHDATEQFQVTEFAYSGLLANATMELNYLDMLLVKANNEERGTADWQESADAVLERTYLQTIQINAIDSGDGDEPPSV